MPPDPRQARPTRPRDAYQGSRRQAPQARQRGQQSHQGRQEVQGKAAEARARVFR